MDILNLPAPSVNPQLLATPPPDGLYFHAPGVGLFSAPMQLNSADALTLKMAPPNPDRFAHYAPELDHDPPRIAVLNAAGELRGYIVLTPPDTE